MRLIEEFECEQKQIYGDGSRKTLHSGSCKIKTELIRPVNILVNQKPIYKNTNHLHVKELIINPYRNNKNEFTKEEFLFLAKTYDFVIKEDEQYEGYYYSKLDFHPLYYAPGEITFIEQNEKEYVIILFTRWQTEMQPRSAGEDMLGPDVTYIHGIWETPLLTDDIIAKIKAH